jgi:hypothetical protein
MTSYRIVIPTRDSAVWIGTFAAAYRKANIEPLYLCDTRSSDGTISILKSINADIVLVEPAFDRVECMLSTTKKCVQADWVIRFDDDEMPSTSLIKWLDASLPILTKPTIAFSRRDAFFVRGQLSYSRLEDYFFYPQDPSYLGPQWRGFRPQEVEFHDQLHSPGFSASNAVFAPPGAFFTHFDWILRSFWQRVKKIERYEAQSLGGGWGLARFYLPELHTEHDLRWTPFEDDEFQTLSRVAATLNVEST